MPVRISPGEKKLIKSVGELIDSGKLLKGQKMMRKCLAQWKKCTFRIGVIGNAGTGKIGKRLPVRCLRVSDGLK